MTEKGDIERKLGEVPVIQEYPKENQVRVLDVVLDRLPLPEDVNARRFIPKIELLKASTCWDTPTVLLIRDMAVRLKGGIASRNEGPTGVSKSYAAEVICALTNRSYLRHNYSKDSDPGDTIGRFVPADAKLAVRFKELLADPDLPESLKEIVESAEKQSRPLTLLESKKIAAALGIDGLDDTIQWRWQNGTLAGSMMYGSVYGADEPNLAPGNVIERENSAIERMAQLRIVEHEGEIIRPLTPEEQSIIDNGGIVPGVIGLDSRYWYVAAQNPFGIGGGRFEESEARRNRLQDRIVEGLTTKEYEEFLRFLIKGEQPDIVWQNRRYKGEKDVRTEYRDLENIPNVDAVIKWLAAFQGDLSNLASLGKIGSEKDIKGGSYVYTRRNLLRILDSIKAAQTTLIDVDELFRSGQVKTNDNWHDLFMEAVYQEYLAGMYREDQEIVLDLIKASGVEDVLGESKNNPRPPEWVGRAAKKGVQVEQWQHDWQIS
ncbi:MAG: hypothetical protein UT12_C0002G0003 [Candidatus Curtissbacteria bacterium GW2011_GWC2_38_9]|uniref:ATPase dynein-related AAA domain-containing protein n=3 Tax=Candidatus Curtissiibacteriota TaxID=1752717 RepID=A0A1F5HRA3_9BACT|nr:MAG: hypothetical protein UT12_C0002G0003 [Candidatus Curtissbacteria bacterium GW2011_GWC2_38_9]KKS04615.1 MAG: hypothetical protein UU56_C0004G0016 [Candidatus Curtissbacteria bacterium GW2011_GWA2_41_24]OGD89725.1 MAG: hypothetical protein A2Z54_01005 [Candidatus Curtissbacteria bacterium RIFCSPHIGHO2_02_39_8]OGE06741.1 MAG: hypothetical protein A2W70_04805 [Candidatus Curtissbacteria bacterium RIFCSPLOWO2_02_41_11]